VPQALRLNLTALVALATVSDLVGRRALAALLLPHAALSAGTNAALVAAGAFFSHFSGVLGLVLVATTLFSPWSRRLLFPRAIAVSLFLIGGLFVVLGAAGIASTLSDVYLLYLKIMHAFLSAFVVIGFFRVGVGVGERGQPTVRERLGIMLLVLPGVAHALGMFAERAPWLRDDLAATPFTDAGEWIALVTASLLPFLLLRRTRDRRNVAAVSAGVVAVALVALAVALRFDLTQALVLHGFRLDLPVPAGFMGLAHLALFSLGAGGFVTATLRLLLGSQEDRLIAYGLVTLVCAGYQSTTPSQLVLALVGLLAMGVGLRRRAGVRDAPREL
jgi:hypothetical protein